MFSFIKNKSKVLLVLSLIKNKSMGIEDYQILLMFSLIKNESIGIKGDQLLLQFTP